MIDTSSKIIVGLSGGVDSSVAAYLLLKQGYHVEGLFMKNWEEDDTDTWCAAQTDLEDVDKVCQRLGISYRTVNFASEYWDNVFEYFLAEFRAGRTPNPDVLCNREIKFKVFLQHALDQGAQAIATGHYAQLDHTNESVRLLKAADNNKDQTYFLALLNQAQLAQSVFPLGQLQKAQVRKLAAELQLPNYNKKDSTGICFIGERPFKKFLEQYLPAQPGEIISASGDVLGTHQGLMYYTLGQRQGLGIGGNKKYGTEPWYVADKLLAENKLVVVQGSQHPLLFKRSLTASQVHWINKQPDGDNFRCCAKTRYRQSDQQCIITFNNDNSIHVEFDQPQRAVTPGQFIVFYNQQECLGGGVIN